MGDAAEPARAQVGDVVGGPGMDHARFYRLMALAGPADRRELLHRLHCDLEGVQTRLAAALAPSHWAEVQGQTHILVALAGAVGAVRLQHAAEALNAVAHLVDDARLPDAAALVLGDLATLIGFVARHRSGMAPWTDG